MCHQNPVYDMRTLRKILSTIKLSIRSPCLSPPILSFSGIRKVRKYGEWKNCRDPNSC
jgi:hypothetical protein